MMALLIKDWRLNAPVTICLGVIYLLLPFIVFASHAADEGMQNALTRETLMSCFFIGAACGIGISFLIVPALGGIAFARERRDRSAEFLASLSVSRTSIVGSKTIVATVLFLLPWLLSGVLLLIGWAIQGFGIEWMQSQRPGSGDFEPFKWLLLIQLMLFGIAWLLSSLVRSETIAAAAAIFVVVLLCLGYALYRIRLERVLGPFTAADSADFVAMAVSLILGIGGFIGGTIIALKRISP